MSSAIWRIAGLETGGGDLVLTALELWGETGRVDIGATVTCTHNPIAGSLAEALNGTGYCSFAAADACSAGFQIVFTLTSEADVWCARFAGPDAEHSVANYELGNWEGGRWTVSPQGRLRFAGAGQLTALRNSAPVSAPVGWSQISGATGYSSGFYRFAASKDGRVLCVVSNGSGVTSSGVQVSMDAGMTWRAAVGAVAGTQGFYGVAVSADGSTILAAGGGSAASVLNISTDAGVSWRQVSSVAAGPNGFNACALSANGHVMVVVPSGSQWTYPTKISRDSGLTWDAVSGTDPYTTEFRSCAVSADGSKLLLGGRYLNYSRDGGATWAWNIPTDRGPRDSYSTCALSADGRVMAGSGAASDSNLGVLISLDGGTSWRVTSALETPVNSSGGFRSVSVSEDGRAVLACPARPSVSWPTNFSLSTDSGATWQDAGNPGRSLEALSGLVLNGAQLLILYGGNPSYSWIFRYLERDSSYDGNPILARPVQAQVAISAEDPEHKDTLQLQLMQKLVDVEFDGRGVLYGSVSEFKTKAALRRRVRLHRSRDGLLARETWSTAEGSYRFDEINERYEYNVEAWDHELNLRTVVANNLVPEVMP